MVQLGKRMAGAHFGLETQEVAAECASEQVDLLSGSAQSSALRGLSMRAPPVPRR